MEHLKLGPNGGFVYCMEYLEKNMDWLLKRLTPLKDKYLLFDLPGQVSLFLQWKCFATGKFYILWIQIIFYYWTKNLQFVCWCVC